MPTNDERREVAARLREIEIDNYCCCEDYLDALEYAIGCRVGIDYREPTYRLADLIEPLPERTCRNIHPDVFQCSECYAIDDDWKNPPYCHGCGAKVVE